jgi:ATP-dependent helicase IRC3
MILRDYQQKLIEQYREKLLAGISRICLTAPTASGKTVIFCEITRQAIAESKRVLIIAHRNELLTQPRDKLQGFFGITAGIIKAGRDKDQRPQSLVQIAVCANAACPRISIQDDGAPAGRDCHNR